MSDPLASIISLLRPQTVLSKIVSGAGKWSIRKPRYEDPAFCLLLDGSCFLDPDGVGPLELKEGDFVLLPETPSFTLASDLSISPTLLAFDHSRETHYGTESGPVTMRMLGGYFRFDRANAQLLVRLLPSVIHIRREEPGAMRLRRDDTGGGRGDARTDSSESSRGKSQPLVNGSRAATTSAGVAKRSAGCLASSR